MYHWTIEEGRSRTFNHGPGIQEQQLCLSEIDRREHPQTEEQKRVCVGGFLRDFLARIPVRTTSGWAYCSWEIQIRLLRSPDTG